MVGVPIGIEPYIVERAVGVAREGCADFLARFLASLPDKQANVRMATEYIRQNQLLLPRARHTHGYVPASMEEGRQRGAVGPFLVGTTRTTHAHNHITMCIERKVNKNNNALRSSC